MYHVSAQGVDERMINVHYCCLIISLKGIKKIKVGGGGGGGGGASKRYNVHMSTL